MNFFWKIFFAVMFISVSCMASGGYILINSNFSFLLENEVQRAYDYGDIVYYSISNEFRDMAEQSYYMQTDVEVAKVADSININSMNQKIDFNIIDDDGTVVFSSLNRNFGNEIICHLNDNEAGWSLKETKTGLYVQAVRTAVFHEDKFYIETARDVSFIFENQRHQYEMLLKIMVCMLIFGGFITFVVSKMLMKRVVNLTKVTKKISAGNLGKRADVRGDDEIAILSKNFNKMAEELEEKINRLKDEAERKELFVGAFSHEIKTPLTSVIGYSDMLMRSEMSAEKIHICAEYIFSEGKRLENLSMKLLELIVLKNQKIKLIPTDMKEFFDSVCFIVLPQIEKSGIELICNAKSAVINMEPELMKAVLINVIDNAKKAIDGKGKIEITGEEIDGVYTVKVCDTGKGMETHELSKIKEAFYMVDKSRSRKQGGAGLGLAICDEILKLHGFEISFKSEIDVGTTVFIYMGEAKWKN
ncbi:MAG: HAMP domain-containing histidine kinase [Firmicutes bacterium]|nr:HAMP domain-containing histidine kinase [Bacillota bacterium]